MLKQSTSPPPWEPIPSNNRWLVAIGCLLLCTGGPLSGAVTNTFQTAGTWSQSANWSRGSVPADGEHVIIAANLAQDVASPHLASYTLNANRTHSFEAGWESGLTATVVIVNGIMRHPLQSATSTNAAGDWMPEHRILIVCGDFTLNGTGTLNADARGYQGNATGNGYGPGGGQGSLSVHRGGGGGYGGIGGRSGKPHYNMAGGPAYGLADAPTDPGSAGGRGYGASGGHGGGAIRIIATGHTRIDGTITANGQAMTYGGAGSGGGIFVSTHTIDGAGTIRANGGNGNNSGGGAGGRIAIAYDPAAQATISPAPTMAFNTAHGAGENSDGIDLMPGTLYLTDTTFFPTPTLTGVYRLIIPGFTAWSPDQLTFNNAWVLLPDGFNLSVSNEFWLKGASSRLLLTNGTLNCGGTLRLEGTLTLTNLVLPAGDLIVTNRGQLHIVSAATNLTESHGALVSVMHGDVLIGNLSHIYPYSHPTNGGSVLFQLRNLTIESGGSINADGRGTMGIRDLVNNLYDGYGPGGGKGSSGSRGGGGGYGGVGGTSSHGWAGGIAYGSSNAPVDPGSAGGAGSGNPGHYGGGLIRIEAPHGTVRIDGLLSANGANGTEYGGGGSGGGIYVFCRRFTASGTTPLRAHGGNARDAGGGGGGRIAVWRIFGEECNAAVAGGTPTSTGQTGQPGTVVWIRRPLEGSVLQLR